VLLVYIKYIQIIKIINENYHIIKLQYFENKIIINHKTAYIGKFFRVFSFLSARSFSKIALIISLCGVLSSSMALLIERF
jgi:hypothetical protein